MTNELYQAIEAERSSAKPKILKKDISKNIGKFSTRSHLWKTIQTGIVRLNIVMKICVDMELELIIRNPRQKINPEHDILADDLNFYRCINLEKEDREFKYSNEEVAALVGAPTSRGNVWNNIKENSLQWNDVVTICDNLGLELILRNTKRKISYLLNNPNTERK